jgi:hypothetical protein
VKPDLPNPWINLRNLSAAAAVEQGDQRSRKAIALAPPPRIAAYVAQAYTTSGQHAKAKNIRDY